MNSRPNHFSRLIELILFGGFLLTGCSHQAGGSNLSGDANRLEKVFALTSSSPSAAAGSDFKTADTAALVKALVDALHAKDMSTVASALHTLNFRGSGLSFDQYDAIRLTYTDVSQVLSKQAANGDQQAGDLLSKMRP